MRTGDIIAAEISRLGAQGDGLSLVKGRPLYIPLALAGEQVKVKLARPIGDGFQADLVEVVTPSSDRITPPCSHFAACGGCSLQHLNEQAYQAHKEAVVVGALRQHKLDESIIRPLITIAGPTRRRLTLAAMRSAKGAIIGFNARASANIVDIKECLIARPELIALLPKLREVLGPWLETAKTLDIAITLVNNGIDVLITGAAPTLAAREAIIGLAKDVIRVSWRGTERVSPEPMLVQQEPLLSFGGVNIVYPAGVFLQPSVEGERILTAQMHAALEGITGPIADLFAGLGTFALPLAATHDVRAFDSDGPAMERLAALRHPRLTTEQRDLFREPLSPTELEPFKGIVIDPPRAGAAAQCAVLADSDVEAIAMISCNPGTFARDAVTLIKGGYQLNWVQPVDQFVWSHYTELVAQFTRG